MRSVKRHCFANQISPDLFLFAWGAAEKDCPPSSRTGAAEWHCIGAEAGTHG